MPKQMPFDAFGINFPQSYWELAQFNVSLIDKVGSITFFGYSSQQARLNGDRMIGNKTYRVTPQLFNDFLVNSKGELNLIYGAYLLAETVKDTSIGKDGTLYSFFNNATDV